MIRALVIGIVLVLPLLACKRDILIEEKWDWKDHSWISSDVKTLSIEATDTSTVYRMDLKLEHNTSYAFQNLYIRTKTTFPSGKEVSSITSLELTLPDGSWAGDCSAKKCSLLLPLQKRFTFPETGTYLWTIEPYMRIDTISGINSLSVICQKATD